MNVLLGAVGPQEYSSRDETVELLTRRAEGLPVRTGTTVTAVRRVRDVLRVSTGDDELEARTLVIASGPKNVPLRPAAAVNLAPHLTSIDADHYRNPAVLPDGGVHLPRRRGARLGCEGRR